MLSGQRRRRVDAQLVAEHAPEVVVDAQRLDRPAGTCQRRHQEGTRALAQRFLGGQRGQLDDDAVDVSGSEPTLGAHLARLASAARPSGPPPPARHRNRRAPDTPDRATARVPRRSLRRRRDPPAGPRSPPRPGGRHRDRSSTGPGGSRRPPTRSRRGAIPGATGTGDCATQRPDPAVACPATRRRSRHPATRPDPAAAPAAPTVGVATHPPASRHAHASHVPAAGRARRPEADRRSQQARSIPHPRPHRGSR